MGALILLAVIAVAIVVIRSYLRMRREQRLRENFPERRVIEATLPGGVKDSQIAMARFWRKVASSTTSDPKVRQEGKGQIDLVFLGTVPEPRAMTCISCLIYADPERMDAVKRALKGVFEDVDVIEHKEDPLALLAEALKPRPDKSKD